MDPSDVEPANLGCREAAGRLRPAPGLNVVSVAALRLGANRSNPAMLTFARARERMVDDQIARRGVCDQSVLDAMQCVPREAFVEPDMEECAYEDWPLPIGEGQTISQPYIVALMIEAAEVKPGDRVLEVGAGSGYAAAVISRIAGKVYTVER